MKITVKTKDLELTPSIMQYIDLKLAPLAKFVKRFDLEGAAELVVVIARTTGHHHKGEVFEAKGDLRLPGRMLHAADKETDIRAAIDLLKNKLHTEIEKYKTRYAPDRQRTKRTS